MSRAPAQQTHAQAREAPAHAHGPNAHATPTHPPLTRSPPPARFPSYPRRMSTFQAPGGTFGVNPDQKPQSGTNWAGVIGFVLAIVSLVACCVPYLNVGLALLAIILCVVGLFHAKKGLAIAGVIIGGIVLILAILWTVAFGSMTSAFKPMGAMGSAKAFFAVATVEDFAKKNGGTIPADLASTGQDPSMFTDGWDTPFAYTARGDNTYTLVSAGPDKQMGTSDDIDIGKGMRDRGWAQGFPNLRALTDPALPAPDASTAPAEVPAPAETTPPADGETGEKTDPA